MCVITAISIDIDIIMGLCLDKNADERFGDDGGEDIRGQNENQQVIDELQKEQAKPIEIVGDDAAEQAAMGLQETDQLIDKQKVTLQDFEFVKVLGRGSFGKVMLVEYKRDRRFYAMKILRKDMVEKRNQKLHTKNERSILEAVRHPFVVRLHFAFQTTTKLYLIMDFMIGGELFFHLRRAFKFSEDRAKFYCAELILALECLHKKGIIYRDLKPENILIGEDGHIKLTDFGLSKTDLKEGEKTNTFCGTPEYLAPEILLAQGHNQSVDWWSLVPTMYSFHKGALLYEMLSGAPPFYSKDKTLMFRNRLEKPIEMKQWFSANACSLLQQLLQNNLKPTLRLGYNGAADIKNHPFFAEVEWSQLLRRQIDPPFKPKVFNSKDLRNFDQMFTDEPVQDTPIQGGLKTDDYERFTYMKNLDHSMVSGSSVMKPAPQIQQSAERFIEVNDNFAFTKK